MTWFRAFEAAARHLSFTVAADELGLTQSAISQHVRALEDRFGVALFERKPRGLALTDAGRRLLPDVVSAIETLAGASAAFDRGPGVMLLTVAASVSMSQWYLAPRLSKFQKRHPDTIVRITNATWPDEYHQTRADVEIRFGPESQVGTDADLLTPNGLIAVATKRMIAELAQLEGDLYDMPLIETVGTSDSWSSWAKRAGMPPPPQPSIYVDHYGLAVDMARAGGGIALVSAIIAAPLLRRGQLHKLSTPVLAGTDGYYLALNNSGNPAAVAFADWFRSELIP